MKILICGGNGEVGKDLADYLSKEHSIIISSRSSKNKKTKNIIYKKLDFSKKIMINQKIDLIINCIATHEFSQKKQLEDYYLSNVQAVFNIIKFAKKNNSKIINLSTISIYDVRKNFILKENQHDIASNKLAVTKFIGEKLFELSTLNFINLRMPGVLSTNYTARRPWLRTVISKINKNQNIKCFNLNMKFNSLIDTREIYKFIKSIIKKKFFRGTYNFSASNPIKLKKLLMFIIKKTKSKSKLIDLGHSDNKIISNNLIKKKLTFNTNTVKRIIIRNLNG